MAGELHISPSVLTLKAEVQGLNEIVGLLETIYIDDYEVFRKEKLQKEQQETQQKAKENTAKTLSDIELGVERAELYLLREQVKKQESAYKSLDFEKQKLEQQNSDIQERLRSMQIELEQQ